MAEHILKEATQLGSTLTKLASQQLGTVLKELRGPLGEESLPDQSDSPSIVNLAGDAFQILGQIGSLLTQLSHFDLVRNDTNVLRLASANEISTFNVQIGKKTPYALLIENNGRKPLVLTIEARFPENERIAKPFDLSIGVGERLRRDIPVTVASNKFKTFTITAVLKSDKTYVAKKTIALNVLTQTKPPSNR